MASLAELLSQLNADNRIRGQQFERICKWYLENDPKYRLLLKAVWLWRDWPGRWGPDTGIDLVAETHEGKLWAIQAKAYSSEYQITKRDIDSFLSESSRHIFDYRLIIATTNSVGHNAEQALHGQEKPVGRLLLGELQRSDLDWPVSPEALTPQPLPKKQPWPYQEQAISDVCAGLTDRDRGQLIMACGTGKTLVAMWAAGRLQCRRVLVLVPSLTLLSQTISAWTANAPWDFRYIAVCSDETVVEPDCLRISVDELGIPVTTDPHELTAFLGTDEASVVFSTYQSSPQIAHAFGASHLSPFDLAIADEAHRCSGLTSGPFGTILDAQAIPAKWRLFMTATPRYFTGRVREEASVADLEVASMDDEQKFGPVFHLLSFSKAINQGLLSDYRVVIIGVDDARYLQYARTGLFVTTDGKYVTDARLLASHIAVVKAICKFDLRRIITFHNRIARAERFARELPRVVAWMPQEDRPARGIWAEHVSGDMSAGLRARLLHRFRQNESGEHCLLANARCLGEGVDVPDIDGVAFIDPRHSQLDIIQAIGRAIRRAEHKECGTVILPVFVPGKSESITREGSPFEPVWMVLKALRAHDEALGELLDDLRRGLGRDRATEVDLPTKITIDMPVRVEQAFAQALRLKIIEQTTCSWEFYFGLLEAYVEAHGHTLVPVKYVARGGHQLGAWVFHQRQSFQLGRISRTRQRMLETLKGWVWDASSAKWQEGFRRLCAYITQNGNPAVPPAYSTEDGYNLGTWVLYQHIAHHMGRLHSERAALLEELSGWTWRDVAVRAPQKVKRIQPDGPDPTWASGLQHLHEYVDATGHALVPRDHICQDGFALGGWVATQRRHHREAALRPSCRKELRSIPGWRWDINEAIWAQGLIHLREYVRGRNLLPVPSTFICADGFRLGAWVGAQRVKFREGTLPKSRRRAIEKVPGWTWDRRSPTEIRPKERLHNADAICWSERLNLLHQFVQKNGHADVPAEYKTEDGVRLGAWVRNQRQLHSAGLLPQERMKALERIPTWAWRILDKQWQAALNHLLRYIEQYGHPLVPRRYTDKQGFKLGLWVMSQRDRYRKGELAKARIAMLESLPGWAWNPRSESSDWSSARWIQRFTHLKEYVQREGHACVPQKFVAADGFKLGTWVGDLRSRKKKGKLSTDRKRELEQLPGWTWNPRSEAADRPSLSWIRGLLHLKQYLLREGHACVPQKFVAADGFKLGTWVGDLRSRKKKGKLSTDGQRELEQLPGWTWDASGVWEKIRSPSQRNAGWMRGFTHLREHLQREGHACVPRSFVAEDSYRLGNWVRAQRCRKKKGKLSMDEQRELEQLPGWTWDASGAWGKIGSPRQRNAGWMRGFPHLREYVQREGHACVPWSFVADDGFKLGRWVDAQRCRKKKGKLSMDGQRELEQLPGWTWDASGAWGKIGSPSQRNASWMRGFPHLREYVQREGHACVPWSFVADDGFKLGRWVDAQRCRKKKGKLSMDGQRELEQLPGWTWDASGVWRKIRPPRQRNSRWMRGLAHLREYVQREGHACVPSSFVAEDSYRLGGWASEQRWRKKKGKLSTDRQRELEQLPGWTWDARDKSGKSGGIPEAS